VHAEPAAVELPTRLLYSRTMAASGPESPSDGGQNSRNHEPMLAIGPSLTASTWTSTSQARSTSRGTCTTVDGGGVCPKYGRTISCSELAEETSESQPSVPDPAELAALVGDIERALRDGAPPERKAVMEAVVAEIRVRDRGHIEPVFRVPIFGPPYGLVPPAGIEPATHGLGNRCSIH